MPDIVVGFAQQTLEGVAQKGHLAVDFDIGDRLDIDPDAPLGDSPGNGYLEVHGIQIHAVGLFQQRPFDGSAAFEPPIPYLFSIGSSMLASGKDHHLVGRAQNQIGLDEQADDDEQNKAGNRYSEYAF